MRVNEYTLISGAILVLVGAYAISLVLVSIYIALGFVLSFGKRSAAHVGLLLRPWGL
jgi:hypothetical protein